MDEVPYEDDPAVAEVLIEHIRLTTFDGLVKVEGAIARPTMTGQNQSQSKFRTCTRLVLTVAAALQLHEHLNQLAQKFEREGLVKRLQPGSDMKQ